MYLFKSTEKQSKFVLNFITCIMSGYKRETIEINFM